MKIITTNKEMTDISKEIQRSGKSLAFVPTMGYLHEGHATLFDKAKDYSEITVASSFVNPTQFAPNEDYAQYPRNMENDIALAKQHKVDYLFVPDALEIYPIGFATSISLKNITERFEGKFRPSHFDGVALVVAKLFNIVRPDFAVFGQKDYQQSLVIKQMVKDLNFDIKIIVSPTVRENNGLAMSSRNSYLTDSEKEDAAILYKAMETAKTAILEGQRERKKINAIMHQTLRSIPSIKLDYASAALASDLTEPDLFYPNDIIVLLLAVYLGKTRLIDNSLITIPSNLN